MGAVCVTPPSNWSEPESVLPDSANIMAQEKARFYSPFASQTPLTKLLRQQRRTRGSSDLLNQCKSGMIRNIPFVGSTKFLRVSQHRCLAWQIERTCKCQKSAVLVSVVRTIKRTSIKSGKCRKSATEKSTIRLERHQCRSFNRRKTAA